MLLTSKGDTPMTPVRCGGTCTSAAALLTICAILFPISTHAQGQTTGPVVSRLTQPIDAKALVSLPGNTHPLAKAQYDVGPAPKSMPASRLILVLKRSAQQEATLQTWLNSVQDSNSPNFHKWLSPDDFGRLFGVSDADLATLESWLRSNGFTVNKVAKSRLAIEFSGTVGQVESAFHTSVHGYEVKGQHYWANASDPAIPAALSPVVAGVTRLNNFLPRSQAIRVPARAANAGTRQFGSLYTTGDTSEGYTILLGPADAATIYDTPTTLNAAIGSGTTYTGSGVTIAIAGDSNIDITQNANYRATFGLPANPVKVIVDGNDPGENNDAIEAYLDTEVSGGIAPGAQIDLFTAADTDLQAGLFLAITRALDENVASIMNVSFGGCEAAQGTAGNQYIYDLWQQAAAQGITVLVSAGDSGSAGCDDDDTQTLAFYGLAVNGLASTPYNVAVGGTDYDVLYSNFPASFTQYVDVSNTLADHRSALNYIPEEPWNDSTFQGLNGSLSQNVPWTATAYADLANIVAGGGGVSNCISENAISCTGGYPLPSWQSGFALSSTGRNLPDISFLAGNGLYGAAWGLCTDQDYDQYGNLLTDCAGNPATGNNFNLTGVGGTSASAPAFAGMLALIEQKTGGRLGQADYELYNLAKSEYSTVFHDIATGNNSVACAVGSPDCAVNTAGYDFLTGYNAVTGYDEASGLGSADVSQLASHWGTTGFTATTSSLTLNGGTGAVSITHGTPVAVNVDVTAGSGTPTGNVALVDNISPATLPNSGSIGTYALTSGDASGTSNSLPGGSYNVSAHYGGASTFAQSQSNSIAVTVAPESSTTNLTIGGYYDPETGDQLSSAIYGAIFVLDAQPYGNSASAANPDGAATGTVTFQDGATKLGSAALASNGVAELFTSIVPGGSSSITASYPGDASFKASTSSGVSVQVQRAPAALDVTTPQSQYNAGSSIAITATLVDASGNAYLDSLGIAPTGNVTFSDQSGSLGTATLTGTSATATTLASGYATFTSTALSWGGHNLQATYSGDANYAPSAASPITYVYVTAATAKIAVSPASSSIKSDQSLQVTVTLSPSGSLPAPTGSVNLTVAQANNTVVYTAPAATLSGGSATVTIPANSLPLGPLQVSAVYSGDNYYTGASGAAPIQVTSSGTIAPTVALTLPSSPVGATFPVTITVSGPSGDPTPTGSVSITGSGTTSWALTNGTVTFNYTYALNPGSNTLTATYFGDQNYESGTGSGTVTGKGSPAVTFNPSTASIAVNEPLSGTVSVAVASGLPSPTGTVTLSSGSYSSSALTLASGSASFTIPANSLVTGNDQVTATYSGDANYLGSTETLPVSVGGPVTVGMSVSGASFTVAAGATTGNTDVITVKPLGGFTGTVTLTASLTSSPAGGIDPPTFSFGSTSPFTLNGTSASTATLTVTTTAPTTGSLEPASRPGGRWMTAGTTLACFLFLGFTVRRRRWRGVLGVVLLLVVVYGISSCGGNSSTGGGGGGGNNGSGTTAGSYVIKVTATSGSTTASSSINMTVTSQ